MNKRQMIINKCKVMAHISRHFRNVLKCSMGRSESTEHKTTKFWIADFCWKNHLDFYTECTFKNNSRADIVIPEWNLAIEVLHSETTFQFNKKHDYYPIPILAITTKHSREDVTLILQTIQDNGGSID